MRGVCKIALIFLNAFLFFLLLIGMYYFNKNPSENWPAVISAISICTLFIQLANLKIFGFGICDFAIYLFLFSHVFMFGNIYLIAIDKAEFIVWSLIYRYDNSVLIASAAFTLCYLQALNMGIVSFAKFRNTGVEDVMTVDRKIVGNIGLVMALISAPFRFVIDINNVLAAQKSGTYYALESKSGVSDDIALLFVPSIIFLLNSSVNRKVKNLIASVFVIYSVFVMVLTGDRRYQVVGIIVVLLNYFYVNKIKFNVFRILLFSSVGVFGLNMLTQISAIRKSALMPVFQFLNEYWIKFFSFDFFYKIFGEFGLSFITVVIAEKYIPSEVPFQKGFSFWGSIPAMFPIGWIFPEFFNKVSIFRSLCEMEGYPVGASLPGELYANFGILGFIVAFVFGGLIGKCLKLNDMKSSFKIAQFFSVFYVLINLVRASFLEIFRNGFIIIIVPYVLFLLYYMLSLILYKDAKGSCQASRY